MKIERQLNILNNLRELRIKMRRFKLATEVVSPTEKTELKYESLFPSNVETTWVAEDSPFAESMWDLYRDGITQSMLTTWLQCPEKFRLSYCSGLRSTKDASEAMDYGTFQHGILDVVYSIFRDTADKTFKADFIRDVGALCSDTVVRYDSVKREMLEHEGFDTSILVKIAACSYQILPRYFNYWAQRDFVDTQWVDLEKIIDVEFSHKLLSRPIRLRMKLDGVKRENTRLKQFETKTKARFNEDNVAAYLPLDLQTNFYFIGIRLHYKEDPVGTTYNLVKRSELKQKVSENLADYALRIGDEIDKDPGRFFVRIDGHVSRLDIDEQVDELAKKLSALERWWQGLNHYKNTTSCMGSYHPCDFLKLCGQGREDLYVKRGGLFQELRQF